MTMREPGISSILSYRVPQESLPTEMDTAVVLTNIEPVPVDNLEASIR
jgi:hypothetical protein